MMAINEEQMRRRWGVLFLLLGIAILLLWGLSGRVVDHGWVVYVGGAVFLSSGLLCWINPRSVVAELLLGIFCLLMSALGLFAAFGPVQSESESTPIFWLFDLLLLSENNRQALGRVMFAAGAIMTGAGGLFFLGRSLSRLRK